MRFFLTFILACHCLSVSAETITIAVASNFRSVMNQLINEFEAESGHEVLVTYGSSGRFFAQINNGAPFDAFFSADQEMPALLEAEDQEQGKEDGEGEESEEENRTTRSFTYAIGALALWSKSPGLPLANGELLRQGGFNKLSIANPRLAPYGVAAVEVLAALGLTESTRERWVQGENITQTFQFVDSGNAELGFVALSQIMRNGDIVGGSAWLVPSELHSPIRQDALLLRRGIDKQAARDFMDFVRGDKARMIIQSYGYRFD